MSSFKKIWSVLSPNLKLKSVYLVILMIFNTLFEIIGIGMIIPIISILTNKSFLENFSYIPLFKNYSNNLSEINILIFSVVIILAFFSIKSLYSIFFIWWQQVFSMKVMIDISNRLFKNYLNQPYVYYLNINSSYLINIINREVSIFHSGLMQTITLFTEVILVVTVVCFLMYLEPLASLGAILTIIICVLLFIFSTSKFIDK